MENQAKTEFVSVRNKLAGDIRAKRSEMFSDLEKLEKLRGRERLKRKVLKEIRRESDKIKSELQYKVETSVLVQDRKEGREKKDSVACALAFGAPKSILPNWVIQERLKHYKPENTFSDIESASPTPLTVAKVVTYLKENGLTKVVIIAEPYHALRVERDLLKIAEREGVRVEVEYDKFLAHLPRKTWFTKQSEQFWTRNVAVSRVYETVARMIPFDMYLEMARKETDMRKRGLSIFKRK